MDGFSAKESSFAASNESLVNFAGGFFVFVTGGTHARIGYNDIFSLDGALCHESAHYTSLPIKHGNVSSGAFALALLPLDGKAQNFPDKVVVVGGDYKSPDAADRTAVSITHFGYPWRSASAAATPPHGYRSAVAYDAATKTWITVGPNGTDISIDDGRNWRALMPSADDAADADKNWNALSLPFVVGPKGRIGVLRVGALVAR